ncbi:MAG: hypothetical protein J6B60_02525 [Clostridia bacterium]|nr:hypothetical protein [Clostridia bacterium]
MPIKKFLLKVGYRLIWLFGGSIFLSLIAVFLNKTEIVSTGNGLFWMLLIMATIFMASYLALLRRNYVYNSRKIKWYFYVNITAYAIFALVSLIVLWLHPGPVYACLFAITKPAVYTRYAVKTLYSCLIFHFGGIVANLLAIIKVPKQL